MMAFFNLPQGLVDSRRSDDATGPEPAVVPLRIPGDFPVSRSIVVRGERRVAACCGDDPATHTALVQVCDELGHVPGHEIPLEVFAVLAGSVQVRVEYLTPGVDYS